MKRTFITRLPNKAGAFLKATRIVAQSGANITRVSYNKAVDLHVLFLEVSGSQAQLDTIAVRLNDVGYILNEDNPGKTILLEFHLPNVPSAVLPVLELIDSFNFNITYMSGQENDTDHQDLKVGIYIQVAKRCSITRCFTFRLRTSWLLPCTCRRKIWTRSLQTPTF